MEKRIYSIDSLRAIAVFFVVIAHVHPFLGFGAYGNYVYFVVDTVGQFDVPFFFVASGYFLAKKANPEDVKAYVSGSVQKLSSIYLFGILLSLSATAGVALIRGQSATDALGARLLEGLSPIGLLYYGTSIAVPLWFLTALIFSICFVSLFVAFEKTRYLFPVAATAHVLGLIGMNYPMIIELPFLTRDALFFGFFYVALGFQIRSADWTPDRDRSRVYLGAFAALLAVQFLEQYAIGYIIRDHTLSQAVYTTEYTVSTAFLVFALFAYALSNPDWGKGTVLPSLGRHAVGVYLVHVPVFRTIEAVNGVLRATSGIDVTTTVLWQLAVTPLVYALSLAVYLLAAKAGVVEIGGSHIPRLSRIRARLGPPDSNPTPEAD